MSMSKVIARNIIVYAGHRSDVTASSNFRQKWNDGLLRRRGDEPQSVVV